MFHVEQFHMKDQEVYIKTTDYSITGHTFELIFDEKYAALKTFPTPSSLELNGYYDSEDYISHTDGSRNVFEKTYQLLKTFALKGKLKLTYRCQAAKGSVLDFGCGTGDFLSLMQSNNWKSYGYEINDRARGLAKAKGLHIIEDLNEVEDCFFDVITLWHVFEHLSDPDESILSFKRILKPNGTLIIAVPNFRSYDAQYYGKYWAAFDVPRHLWHFSRKSFEIIAKNHNMKVKKVLPMWFDSFYVSLLSEKYKNGKMNPFRAFWIGLKSNFKGKLNNEFSSHIYILHNK